MNSSTLVERIGTARFFGERKILITAGEIYAAADDAQKELCSECDLLQKRIQLALTSGQEEYSFQAKTVSAVAQAMNDEVVLTIGSHDFHPGDMVHVSDVGGDADGQQIISAVATTTITLEDTDTPPASYTGTKGRVYHYLSAIVRPKGVWGKIVSSTGAKSKIKFIGQETADRYDVDEFTEAGKPMYCIMTFGSTPSLRVLPEPNGEFTVMFMAYGKPLPSQAVSDSADPILDSDYDRALYHGTLFYAISQYKREPGADRYINEARMEFQEAKNQAMTVRAKKEFTVDNDPDDLRAP